MPSLRGGGVRRGYEGVELGFRIFACNLIFTRDAMSLQIKFLGCLKNLYSTLRNLNILSRQTGQVREVKILSLFYEVYRRLYAKNGRQGRPKKKSRRLYAKPERGGEPWV